MLLENDTIIVIAVIIGLLAIAAFVFRKNPIFEMFGVKFRTEDEKPPAGRTTVGEEIEVTKDGKVGKMTGIDASGGDVPMSGEVSVGKGAKVAGTIDEMTGRRSGPATGRNDGR